MKMRVNRVKLHYKEFNKLRNDEALVADMQRRGKAIADAAGAGHEVSSRAGKSRHRVSVITESYEAAKDQAENNTLLRALDAGR